MKVLATGLKTGPDSFWPEGTAYDDLPQAAKKFARDLKIVVEVLDNSELEFDDEDEDEDEDTEE